MSVKNDLKTNLLTANNLNMSADKANKQILINDNDNDVSSDKSIDPDNVIKNKSIPMKQQLLDVLAFKAYRPVLPFMAMYIAAGYMPSVFMSAYGAEWFSLQNCGDNCGNIPYDYVTYSFYSSLFLSLRGVISFLFSSYIGILSDAYGRKIFFYMHIITNLLPILPLLFWYNMWPYFIFGLFGGLNGSNNSATPIMISFIADTIPETRRTIAFGLMYLMGGCGLFLGSITAILISIIFDDYINFIIITLLYIIQLIYNYSMINESLSISNRKILTGSSSWNPFRPLLHINDHPIVCRICIISFLISLPETGVLDTAIPYMLDQLEANDNKIQANIITGIFILLVGFGMIFSNILLLPYLKNHYNDYQISIIGSILISISMFLFASISWMPHIFVVCITAITLSIGFIVFPSLYSIVTKYLSPHEVGCGMGIIFAVRGLTFMIAPFSFGYSYALFKSLGFPSFPYIVATLICMSSILVIIYKLKPCMDLVDLSPELYLFISMNDLSIDQKKLIKEKRVNIMKIYNSEKYQKSLLYKQINLTSSADDIDDL